MDPIGCFLRSYLGHDSLGYLLDLLFELLQFTKLEKKILVFVRSQGTVSFRDIPPYSISVR